MKENKIKKDANELSDENLESASGGAVTRQKIPKGVVYGGIPGWSVTDDKTGKVVKSFTHPLFGDALSFNFEHNKK